MSSAQYHVGLENTCLAGLKYTCGNDTPVTPPNTKRVNPEDPYMQISENCPNGICRRGFASQTTFNSSTCNGNSSSSEMGSGALGVCYQMNGTYFSVKTTCHTSFLRSTIYAGGCNDFVVSTGDIFRKPASCSILDPFGQQSATEIFCPIVSPDPTLSGHASSMSLSLLLAILALLIATALSL